MGRTVLLALVVLGVVTGQVGLSLMVAFYALVFALIARLIDRRTARN